MFFNWVMDNPMYIAVFLVSAALVVAAFRYIILEELKSSDDKDGGIADPIPDVDLPLPTGVTSPVDEPEVAA